MNTKTFPWLTAAFIAASGLIGNQASAQFDPESGDTGEWQPPPEQPPVQQPPPPQQQPPQNTWQQPPTQPPAQQPAWNAQAEQPPGMGTDTETPGQTPRADGETDHSQVSFGLTFFGLDNITVEPRGFRDEEPVSLRMPVIGARLWLTESIGLDVGIGFGYRSEEDFVTCAGDCGAETKVAGLDGAFGIRLHVGLPIALQTYSHFNILLIPEVGFSYAGATFYTPGDDPAADFDIDTTVFDLGVRVGGELQFGFWGVPNLALQATIGLGMRYQSRNVKNSLPEPSAVEGNSTDISLRTIADDLGSTIRILYYF